MLGQRWFFVGLYILPVDLRCQVWPLDQYWFYYQGLLTQLPCHRTSAEHR